MHSPLSTNVKAFFKVQWGNLPTSCSRRGLINKLGDFTEMPGAVEKPHLPGLGKINITELILEFHSVYTA